MTKPTTQPTGQSATARDLPVIGWEARATAMSQQLASDGAIVDPAWATAFASTPRHPFVPRYWELDALNSPSVLIDGADLDQRSRWLDAIYSDRCLVRQWVGDVVAGRAVRVVTSSAPRPCTVAVMLDRLKLADGHRVLEIGTGSGYNTALLCARLGDHLITSIDVDAGLVAEAAAALSHIGFRPMLQAVHGAAFLAAPSWTPLEQFDRIISTCSIERIPAAWFDLLAPGGRLVAPLCFGGALSVLDKTSNDQLEGYIDAFTDYSMRMHTPTGHSKPDGGTLIPPLEHSAPYWGRTDLPQLEDLDKPDFLLWLGLHLPGVQVVHTYGAENVRTETTVDARVGRATCQLEPDCDGLRAVSQHCGRPWDTVEVAWRTWQRAGRPARHQLRLTARRDGTQYVRFESAHGRYEWPLPDSQS